MMHRTSISTGAALTIAMRWSDRLIGLISTLILARLLVPEDFGIIAMASIAIGLVDVFFDLGVNVALIQNSRATLGHYNTAWTLRLIQGSIAAAAVILLSPLVGDYFGDPRVTPVLQIMAAGIILSSLDNIGVIAFQKNMQFGLDFRFMFAKRIAGFIATLLAAWLLQSYWALVIGALVGRSVGVLLSYQMHPMRPRLSLECWREILVVSQWMILRGIGIYLDANLHRALVGRRTSTATMGGYTLADEISAMPSSELLSPLNRVLFPAFVEVKDTPDALKRLFLLAQGVQVLVAVPAGLGLAMVANEAVLLLLGERWAIAVPFVQVLALCNVVQAISTSGCYVMITLGHIRNVALIAWFQLILFAVVALLAWPTESALAIAVLRLATVTLGLSLALWLVMNSLTNLLLWDILKTIVRPLVATSIMAAAILAIPDVLAPSLPALLLLKVILGIVVYVGAVAALWLLSGRPDGPERYLLDKARSVRQIVSDKYTRGEKLSD